MNFIDDILKISVTRAEPTSSLAKIKLVKDLLAKAAIAQIKGQYRVAIATSNKAILGTLTKPGMDWATMKEPLRIYPIVECLLLNKNYKDPEIQPGRFFFGVIENIYYQ